MSFYEGKARLNDLQWFHHYSAATILRAAIHFHNYRLRDLIWKRIRITSFISDIYLYDYTFSRGSCTKAICWGLWKKIMGLGGNCKEMETMAFTVLHVKLINVRAVHIVNWLWLSLKSSSHKANYLTVHRPLTCPASRKGWLRLTGAGERK